jgi:ORF6N domain
MARKQSQSLVPDERIEQSIVLMRGQKVLLDADLAPLYGVEIKTLNRAVLRNRSRFPADFMFRLTRDEWDSLRYQIGTLNAAGQPALPSIRSQIVTLKTGRGLHRKYLPFAFTEQGIAMLSSVLRSDRAVQVNIEIMRAFVRLRQILAVNAELARRLDELERRVGGHDDQFLNVIRAIRQLMEPPPSPEKGRIGFQLPPTQPPSDRDAPARQQRRSTNPVARRRKKTADDRVGGET